MRLPIITIPESRVTRLPDRISSGHLVLVGVGWLVFFFLLPVLVLLWQSLQLSGEVFEYYQAATAPLYLQAMLRTFMFAAVVTVVCITTGFIFSYYLVFRAERHLLFISLVALPLWIAIIIRYFGIALIFLPTGPVPQVFGTDFGVLFSSSGVIIGLVSVMLPFAILPIYSSLVSIDDEIISASRALGASRYRTIYEIVIPMSLSGIVAAAIFVFILSAGSFLAPAILGGPGDFMMANIIVQSFNYNVELASALSVIFTSVLLVIIVLFTNYVNLSQAMGEL